MRWFTTRGSWIWLILLAVAVSLLVREAPGSWASPMAQPNRQTVPTVPIQFTPTPSQFEPVGVLDGFLLPECINPGETIQVTYFVTNLSSNAVTNARVVLTSDPCLTLALVSVDQGSVQTGSLTWDIGTLAPQQRVAIVANVTACDEMGPTDCFDLTASLTWTGADPAQKTVAVCACPSLLPETGE